MAEDVIPCSESETMKLLMTLDHICNLFRQRSPHSGLVINRASNDVSSDCLYICFNRWKNHCVTSHINNEKRLDDDNRQLREKVEKLKGLLSKSHAINVRNQTTDVSKKSRDDNVQADSLQRDEVDRAKLLEIQSELSAHYESQIQLATKLASVRIQETVERATSEMRIETDLILKENAMLKRSINESIATAGEFQKTISGLNGVVDGFKSDVLTLKHMEILTRQEIDEMQVKFNHERRMKMDLEAELLAMRTASEHARLEFESSLRAQYEQDKKDSKQRPQTIVVQRDVVQPGIAQLMRENDVLKRSCQELKSVVHKSRCNSNPESSSSSSLDCLLIEAIQEMTVAYQSSEEKSMTNRSKYELMVVHFRLSKAIHRAEALVEFVTWKLVPFVGKGLEKLVLERDRGGRGRDMPATKPDDDDDDNCAIYAMAVEELKEEISRLEEELEGIKIERSPWVVDSPATVLEPGRSFELPLPIRHFDTELNWKYSSESTHSGSAKADAAILDSIVVNLIQYQNSDVTNSQCTITQPTSSAISSSNPAVNRSNGDGVNNAPLIQLLVCTHDVAEVGVKPCKTGHITIPVAGMTALRFTNSNIWHSLSLSSKVACIPPDDPRSDPLLQRLEVVEAAKSRLEMALYGAEVISNHVISWYCKWRQCRLSVKHHSLSFASCHRQFMTISQHKIKLQCEVELDKKCVQACGKTMKQLQTSSSSSSVNDGQTNSIAAITSDRMTYQSNDIMIAPGKDFRVKTALLHPGDTFQWLFSISSPGLQEAPGLDIGFGICRENDKSFDQVVAYSRLRSPAACPVCGTFVVSIEGVYVFIWDNTYSWLNPKALSYKVETKISSHKEIHLNNNDDDDDDDVHLPAIVIEKEVDKRQDEIDSLNGATNELCETICRQKELLEMTANELESLAPYALGLCNEVTEFMRAFSDLPSKSL